MALSGRAVCLNKHSEVEGYGGEERPPSLDQGPRHPSPALAISRCRLRRKTSFAPSFSAFSCRMSRFPKLLYDIRKHWIYICLPVVGSFVKPPSFPGQFCQSDLDRFRETGANIQVQSLTGKGMLGLTGLGLALSRHEHRGQRDVERERAR